MKDEKLTRRGFMKVSARYGVTSTFIAAGTLGAGATLSQLAQAAEQTTKKRYAVKPKFQLKFGASGFNEKNLDIQKSGQLFFAKDLEARTNGAIRVEFIGSNQICGQTNCVKKLSKALLISTLPPRKTRQVVRLISTFSITPTCFRRERRSITSSTAKRVKRYCESR